MSTHQPTINIDKPREPSEKKGTKKVKEEKKKGGKQKNSKNKKEDVTSPNRKL